jgi:hypothetical protein
MLLDENDTFVVRFDRNSTDDRDRRDENIGIPLENMVTTLAAVKSPLRLCGRPVLTNLDSKSPSKARHRAVDPARTGLGLVVRKNTPAMNALWQH